MVIVYIFTVYNWRNNVLYSLKDFSTKALGQNFTLMNYSNSYVSMQNTLDLHLQTFSPNVLSKTRGDLSYVVNLSKCMTKLSTACSSFQIFLNVSIGNRATCAVFNPSQYDIINYLEKDYLCLSFKEKRKLPLLRSNFLGSEYQCYYLQIGNQPPLNNVR